MKIGIPVLLAAGALAAGCGSHPASPVASTPATTAAAPATASSAALAATPVTAAAARSAAQALFALYAAGQYRAVYPLLDAPTRAEVPEHKWVTVHEDCTSPASGLSYKVGRPVMAGQTAVMSVSLSGVASSLGSEEESFVYQDGGWFWSPTSMDMSAAGSYKGTVAQIVARLKAAGRCN
jgi:hypothetical protein